MPRDLQQAMSRKQVLVASSAKLLSKANAAAILFMQTELETGLSFARMAPRVRSRKETRPRDAEKIKRYLAHARTARDEVANRIGTVKGAREELRQIKLKFSQLRKLSRLR
jgi:hypothetical protein